jgi:O-acetyl-ADP-ribose deacetylase
MPVVATGSTIHVAGISMAGRASAASVRASTRRALRLARWPDARSVALPLIGAGSGGLKARVTGAVMLKEMNAARQHFDLLELVALPRR